ncbi:MAG: diacylglycerol kinase [Saprospiraceae bacterium]
MRNRILSFGYAIHGIKVAFKEEPNFRIHVLGLIVVLSFGFYCNLSVSEWIQISIVSSIVIITELLNTAIEDICNYITKERITAIGRIKDVAAAAVLVSAIMAALVGFLIFKPYIVSFF